MRLRNNCVIIALRVHSSQFFTIHSSQFFRTFECLTPVLWVIYVMVGSGNGLSPFRHQIIICTNATKSSWGQHGAQRGHAGPRWTPCWPHEPCYHGTFLPITIWAEVRVNFVSCVPGCWSRVCVVRPMTSLWSRALSWGGLLDWDARETRHLSPVATTAMRWLDTGQPGNTAHQVPVPHQASLTDRWQGGRTVRTDIVGPWK